MRYLILLSLLFTAAASGATRITSVDASGESRTVLIGKDFARIDRAIPGGYMLVDLNEKKAYAVDTEKGFIMDLDTPFVERSAHGRTDLSSETPDIRLTQQGAGPVINRYATRHYRVYVEDRFCFDEYLAPAPLDKPGVRRFLEIMAGLSTSSDEVELTMLFEGVDPCEIAADSVDDQYATHGIPMRTVRDGRKVHEITRIESGVELPADFFVLPAGYPVLSRQEVQERLSRKGFSDAEMAEVLKRNEAIQEQMENLSPHVPGPLGGKGPVKTIDLFQ
ncbi:MAG TPA: hypothetical protein ENJ22_03205 [Gammaproteobacteria bacterium]|nr:hypothetical protein [Gammaproteobacteria bacterium]